MKNKMKSISVKKRVVILPFLLILFAYLLITISSVNRRIEYYQVHLKQDSLDYAKSYSVGISKSAEAQETLNQLLEERLLVASRSTIMQKDELTNERLSEMAERYRVDVIYFFNHEGEVVSSSSGEFIGWKAPVGHPVNEFMINPYEFQTDEIRQDTENLLYYKYAYFQREDGSFVQVGIYAEEVYEFLGSFEMQQLLDEIKNTNMVHSLYFIDNNLEITSSTNENLIGNKITDLETVNSIRRQKDYTFTTKINDEILNYGLVPVYIEDGLIGTLAVGQTTEDRDLVLREAVMNGFYNLSIIFLVMGFFAVFAFKKNKQLMEMAYYDRLTGLPNQEYLKEYVFESIETGKTKDKAILLINTSNFRYINMTYGYEYGDEILKTIAKRLKTISSEKYMLFRFTSDRFVVYVENYKARNELVDLTDTITRALDNPIENGRNSQYLDSQVAIVESIGDYSNVDNLLREVSIALDYISKDSSENYIFFSRDMVDEVNRGDIIENEIRDFVLSPESDNIYLEYQPKVEIETGRITGFEALARMNSEKLGVISPIEFIDIAERRLIIAPLGYKLLEMAAGFAKNMNCEISKDTTIAVNISGIQILRNDFVDRVKGILDRHELDPSRLEFEITETILLENYEIINHKLKELRELGIEISLDDFGTGYSSLSRLGELNVGVIKIDRYFISKIDDCTDDSHLTHDIISMGHKSGLKVVAEGVETVDQLEYLRRNNCDYMQGYLFSKPISPDEATKLLISTNMNNNIERW